MSVPLNSVTTKKTTICGVFAAAHVQTLMHRNQDQL